MRERSHKKGEIYQQDAKTWLSRTSFLGCDAELFGDAYDVTKKACAIGGVVFDFSLKLRKSGLIRQILYAECKYRDEKRGAINTDFERFLKRAYDALDAANPDDAQSAVFVFLSTLPPDDWRRFLKNRRQYCQGVLAAKLGHAPDDEMLGDLIQVVHLFVVSAKIVERRL